MLQNYYVKKNLVIIIFTFFIIACSSSNPPKEIEQKSVEKPKTTLIPKIILQTDKLTGEITHCQATLDSKAQQQFFPILPLKNQAQCNIQLIPQADVIDDWIHNTSFYASLKQLLTINGLTFAINEPQMIKGLVLSNQISQPKNTQAVMVISADSDDELGKIRVILQENIKNMPNVITYITPSTQMTQYVNEQNAKALEILQQTELNKEKIQTALNAQVINFALGRSDLPPINATLLQKSIIWLKNNPQIKIHIIGYTDNTGDEDYNKQLSLKRAKALQQYFIEQGIDKTRLHIEGQGSQNPVADNNSELGRFKNRRIEFQLSTKE